jgi:hypothetical protein
MDPGDDFFPNVRGYFGLRFQIKRFYLQILVYKSDFIRGSTKSGPIIL